MIESQYHVQSWFAWSQQASELVVTKWFTGFVLINCPVYYWTLIRVCLVDDEKTVTQGVVPVVPPNVSHFTNNAAPATVTSTSKKCDMFDECCRSKLAQYTFIGDCVWICVWIFVGLCVLAMKYDLLAPVIGLGDNVINAVYPAVGSAVGSAVECDLLPIRMSELGKDKDGNFDTDRCTHQLNAIAPSKLIRTGCVKFALGPFFRSTGNFDRNPYYEYKDVCKAFNGNWEGREVLHGCMINEDNDTRLKNIRSANCHQMGYLPWVVIVLLIASVGVYKKWDAIYPICTAAWTEVLARWDAFWVGWDVFWADRAEARAARATAAAAAAAAARAAARETDEAFLLQRSTDWTTFRDRAMCLRKKHPELAGMKCNKKKTIIKALLACSTIDVRKEI